MIVKFITLKWGTKYGPEYVNRLYKSIKKTYSGDFEFYCYTDDYSYLDSSIRVGNITDLPHFDTDVFTLVKMDLFTHLPFDGPCAFLDLDVLVLKDLKPYFDEYQFKEPRIGYCYWSDPNRVYNSYHKGDCYVNSSFLTWDKNQFNYVYNIYEENKTLINYKFKSFDKFLFYFCKLNYHPKGIMYSYNFGAEYPDNTEKQRFLEDQHIAIFNTSNERGIELHDCSGWAKRYWECF
jgi:hypothetical protein